MRTIVENREQLHERHKFDDTGFVYGDICLPEQRSCFYDCGADYPMVEYSTEPVSDFAESLKADFYGTKSAFL